MAAALDIESGQSPVKGQLAQGHGLRIAFKVRAYLLWCGVQALQA